MFSWFKKSTSVAPADGLLATKADQKGVKPQFHALTVREVRRITSLTSAVHSVIEEVQVETEQGPKLAFAYATNVYQRTPQGWRLVAHHASPGVPDALPDVDPLASLAAPTQIH